MGGFIDLATFDDLLKIEDVLDTIEAVIETVEETVVENIVEAEPVIMTVIEPMIEAELKMVVAPIIVVAAILEPVISLAAWEAEQQIKATLQALIEKSRKKAIKKKG